MKSMNAVHPRLLETELPVPNVLSRSSITGLNSAAKASMVNRTHRVVRERARSMQANRSRIRSLLLPLLVCSIFMILLFSAFWMVLEQYELLSSDTPAQSHHLFLLLLWFVPVSGALLAMVWFRRGRNQTDAEAIR
ncbi:hypothetical protein [Granulicella arctica]|uniref:hypothetical protein n=1 Tax=Granulicella arctica TaxID=940613 RepID=UPI0021E08A58|nr:hypothetical protein [Granulicella arctica]